MKNSISKTLFSISIILTIISCENNSEKQNEKVVMTHNSTSEMIHNNASEMTHNMNDNQLLVKSSLVCYVNNKYMGKEQIPVEYENKTYYGCCEGCVLNLKNNEKVRYAIDPFTGEIVDKALAIISKKTMKSDDVFYFASMDHFHKYMNQDD